MCIKIKTKDQVNIKNISSFLSTSFEDYIAARILFTKNKLLQACTLANTSIEKYFKALLEAQTTKFSGTHDLTKLLPSIKNKYPKLYNKLNIEFLNQLTKTYLARYIDDLPAGYNCAIIQSKHLAELDYTYSVLAPMLRVNQKSNINSKTKYENAIECKDVDLWTMNYITNNIDKTVFIENPCNVYECRVLSDGLFIEITYSTNSVKNDGVFNYESYVPDQELKKFTLTHKIYQ